MRLIPIFILLITSCTLWANEPLCGPKGSFRMANSCMPVVFVIRHAEDTQSGPHALTAEGQRHAELYPMLFQNYIWGDTHSVGVDKAQACVCPIGKIISISNKGNVTPRNPNPNPSPNPYLTVKNLSDNLNLPISTDNGKNQYWSSFQWTADEKKKLFDYGKNSSPYSVVIAWDKQGLNPTEEEYNKLVSWLTPPESQLPFKNFIPLLKYFPQNLPDPSSLSMDPARTNLWVYSNQNEQGKFLNLRFYHQVFYAKDCKSNESFVPLKDSQCINVEQVSY
ncbi:hypothetical protein ELY15_12835 [Legionella sp. km772]|nr:hypothetical protein ELY15_12835 [Legionella sp. km772]